MKAYVEFKLPSGPITAEGAALVLLQIVAACEDKTFEPNAIGGEPVDRKWVLDTYVECLKAAKDIR
jgi:hypothetical protein